VGNNHIVHIGWRHLNAVNQARAGIYAYVRLGSEMPAASGENTCEESPLAVWRGYLSGWNNSKA